MLDKNKTLNEINSKLMAEVECLKKELEVEKKKIIERKKQRKTPEGNERL